MEGGRWGCVTHGAGAVSWWQVGTGGRLVPLGNGLKQGARACARAWASSHCIARSPPAGPN